MTSTSRRTCRRAWVSWAMVSILLCPRLLSRNTHASSSDLLDEQHARQVVLVVDRARPYSRAQHVHHARDDLRPSRAAFPHNASRSTRLQRQGRLPGCRAPAAQGQVCAQRDIPAQCVKINKIRNVRILTVLASETCSASRVERALHASRGSLPSRTRTTRSLASALKSRFLGVRSRAHRPPRWTDCAP
ncbi:hypothetical protein EXIGLDRAFT_151816 [Exidia glandulosa HHB12029]|uniref:Secreted protein n=1 Tax=Exidia glandulosa HHB12029 TaxID=1314781 RepID=A0A165QDJ1_EXIGL|nr:hypothetical protein EXIGLDRAFT_151816 [Exidia glandulosa HHB12029]